MLTKGIILSIDWNENTCVVRIPVFETAGNAYQNTATAIVSVQPGIYNGLHINDVVILGFEDHNAGKPVILGKLYLGVEEENKNIGGAGSFTDIKVTNSAELPIHTKINFSKEDSTAWNDEIALTSLNSIYSIINATRENSKEIKNLSRQVNRLVTTDDQIVGTWPGNKFIHRKTIEIDFEKENIGQEKNKSWNTSILLENLTINNLLKVNFISSDSVIFTTSTTGDNIYPAYQKSSKLDNKIYVFDYSIEFGVVTAQFDKYFLNISGTTGPFKLKTGYFTIEYIYK